MGLPAVEALETVGLLLSCLVGGLSHCRWNQCVLGNRMLVVELALICQTCMSESRVNCIWIIGCHCHILTAWKIQMLVVF